MKYVGEEMGITMPRVITVYVDATVAISFAADVGNPTGMKFIDLRDDWVLQLRDRSVCRVVKVNTKLNPADFGTKILDPAEFRRQRNYFLHTPKHVNKCSSKAAGNLAMMTTLDSGSGLGSILCKTAQFHALFRQ